MGSSQREISVNLTRGVLVMLALPVGRIWGRNLGHSDAAKNCCGSKLWSAAKSVICISEGKTKTKKIYKFSEENSIKIIERKSFVVGPQGVDILTYAETSEGWERFFHKL